jgi:hypothetical protein
MHRFLNETPVDCHDDCICAGVEINGRSACVPTKLSRGTSRCRWGVMVQSRRTSAHQASSPVVGRFRSNETVRLPATLTVTC